MNRSKKNPTAAPICVQTFTDLVEAVGREVCGRKPDLYLFRGQGRAHQDGHGRETILPKFWRQQPWTLDGLRAVIDETVATIAFQDRFAKDTVAAEAILAHYEVVPTRMLDVTQMLHIAASFALADRKDGETQPAVIYMFGPIRPIARPFPGQRGAFLVASVASEAARRPQRQAAWALFEPGSRDRPFDFHSRVLATFTIPREHIAAFWDATSAHELGWLMVEDEQNAALADVRAFAADQAGSAPSRGASF